MQEHVIKGPCNFMGGSFSLYIPTLPSLVAIDIVVVILMILVYHVISQDNVIIWSCELMGRRRSGWVTILTIFVVIRIAVMGI